MKFELKNATTNCYRFERRDEKGKLETVYLQKDTVKSLGINPEKGIEIEVKEAK